MKNTIFLSAFYILILSISYVDLQITYSNGWRSGKRGIWKYNDIASLNPRSDEVLFQTNSRDIHKVRFFSSIIEITVQ